MGLALGALAITILFQRSPVSKSRLLFSALLASIYWLCIFAAPVFPATAFSDPEFAAMNPAPLGVPAQLFIGFITITMLLASVCLSVFA